MKTPNSRFQAGVHTLIWLLPIAVILSIVHALSDRKPSQAPSVPIVEAVDARLVVVVIDSLRPENLNADLMPKTAARVRDGGLIQRPVQTCEANFTLPCVQTLFEGTESPFVAGLNNFTGTEGGTASLPAYLHASGRKCVLISDHTLGSLYGEYAVESHDVQTWQGSHLEHDLRAFDVAGEAAKNPDISFIALHSVGTDKVAHHKTPGSDAYREHFRSVDHALDELLNGLSASTFVLVTGDHGHGPKGHHTRSSVALFGGAGYQELLAGLPPKFEQRDLLFLLFYPFAFPVPVSADAAFFEFSAQPRPAQYSAFAAAQAASLNTKAAPSVALERARESKKKDRLDPVFSTLPIWVIAVFFIAWLWRRSIEGPSDPRHDILVFSGFALTSVSVAFLTNPALGPVFAALLLGVGVWIGRQHRLLRPALLFGVLLCGAAAISALAESWTDLFHIRDGFRVTWLLFFAILIVAGVVIARAVFGTAWLAPEGALLWAAVVLPSGVYYYQYGQNQFSGLIFAGIPIVAYAIWTRRRSAMTALPWRGMSMVAAALVAALAVFSMLQASGGWEWRFKPHSLLGQHQLASVGLGAIAALVGASLLRTWRARIVWLTVWLLFPLYSVWFAGLGGHRLATSSIFVVLVIAWARLSSESSLLRPTRDRNAISMAILLWAGMTHGLWLETDGFFLNQVDFSFALEVFGNLSRERDVYVLTQLATNLKYGMPFILMTVGVRLVTDRRVFERVIAFTMTLAYLKVFALILQAVSGKAFQSQRLWELALSDLLFVLNITFTLPLLYFAITVFDRDTVVEVETTH